MEYKEHVTNEAEKKKLEKLEKDKKRQIRIDRAAHVRERLEMTPEEKCLGVKFREFDRMHFDGATLILGKGITDAGIFDSYAICIYWVEKKARRYFDSAAEATRWINLVFKSNAKTPCLLDSKTSVIFYER